ncbi:hypothetical protein FRC01_004277 [Tulasnella sp. 417]|nr:hypothetical protein FRC01_004277 [Tulasnella sp. 417]
MATSESQLELFHCLPIPTGDLNDLYDFQAIRMVVVHNIMLRGFNSMAYYCSEVEPNTTKFDAFLDYSSQIIELLHDHHSMEEEMYFPFLERNLGAGAMSENVSGHDTFKPQLEHLDDLVKQLRAHQTAWNMVEFRKATLDLLSPLRKHLGEEIDTLRAWKLKDHFTIAELQGFESALEERIKSNSSLTKSLQLLYVNGDAVHAAW